jgi:5,10-methylenetetrahydrofolate reductase
MNLLALRGDPPQGTSYDPSSDHFQHADDLVKYIRVNKYLI